MEIPFHRASITDDEINEVIDSLKSGWLTTGSKCVEFEKAFSEYVGAKYAVALNSGTAALHLSLEAIGVQEGDVVITSTMTFAATAEVVRYFNARPEFVDIDPSTFNIDPLKLEQKIVEQLDRGAKVKAIIPVHMAGCPCDMDSILSLARKYELHVVEDAAHVLPGRYKDKPVGSISDLTCFSFYATKNITTGEGGMAVTDNPEWAERLRIMSLHGISKDAWKRYTDEGNWYYEVIAPGFKYNMTDLAASIGIAQLKRSDIFMQRREAIARRYNEAFSKVDELEVPGVYDDIQHSWHLYIIRLNLDLLKVDRSQFIAGLKKMGIGTSVHFIPLHLHPYYRDNYGYKPEDFPVAFQTYKRIISLPLYPRMTDDETDKVIESVLALVDKNRI